MRSTNKRKKRGSTRPLPDEPSMLDSLLWLSDQVGTPPDELLGQLMLAKLDDSREAT
jgi:hypothetical protein